MPLNGGGTASRVPGVAPAPNQTVKSADYNSEIADIYNIFNTPRPIAYGGTGGGNKAEAQENLGIVDAPLMTFGQCRLALDGSSLRLSRKDGRLLTINGAAAEIPAAGVALAAAGLTPNTLYYIYAYMNSGTMTLEASTTGHSTDSTTGVEAKSGDNTRTLVGMARPATGPAWADTIARRFVRSYFNRDNPRGGAAFTADRNTSSATLTELNIEIRNEFLSWGDENIQANFSGWGANTGSNTSVVKIIMDNTSTELARCASGMITGTNYSCSGATSPSEGYHYVTVAALTTGGTFTVYGSGSIPALLNSTIV